MNRWTYRVGAFASAVMLLAVSFAADLDSAVAQDQAEPVMLEPVQNFEPAVLPEVRFEVREAAPPLPEEAEAPSVAPIDPLADADSLRELVSVMPAEEGMSRELRCLAQAVYFESRGEPLSGQLAVARVVINRAESGLFPNDYCSVVTQRAQFSFVRRGHIPEPNKASQAWQKAKAIARIAHRELWESEADDALFFHATYVRPSWARSKTARATIDSHIFYR